MSKKIAITIISGLLLLQTKGLCADSNQLTSLDAQRNDLLKQITAQLVAGKIGPTDAQLLKSGLDNVVQLETRAQEDKIVTDAEYQDIANALAQTRSQLATAVHPQKVWMGIDAHDTTLQRKISDALGSHKISKEQADSLMQEAEMLRAREANGSPTNEFEFDDAVSIAGDLLTLDSKIDQVASTGHTE